MSMSERIIFVLVSLVSLMALVSVIDAQADGQINKTICLDEGAAQISATGSQLYSAFTKSPMVDLIVILDISGSISTTSLERMKTFVGDLVTFIQLQYHCYLDPKYVRFEMIVFNTVANLTASNINSCQLESILDAIKKPQAQEKTFVHVAMDLALNLFHKAIAARPTSSQILFVVTDGEFDDLPGDVSLSSYRLRLWKVTVFSCGVGEWLDTTQKENNLKSLTTNSSTNYLCYSQWRMVLSPQRETSAGG